MRGPAGRRFPKASCLPQWPRYAEGFQCKILETVLLILLPLRSPLSFFFSPRKRNKAESHLIPWTSLQSRYVHTALTLLLGIFFFFLAS